MPIAPNYYYKALVLLNLFCKFVRGLLHDDNFTKAAMPAKAAKPPDNFYFVL